VGQGEEQRRGQVRLHRPPPEGPGPQAYQLHHGSVPLPPLPQRVPVLHCEQGGRAKERVHVRRSR